MTLCERCPLAADCDLEYMSSACREARRRECPDVRRNNGERLRDMDNEQMAGFLCLLISQVERELAEKLHRSGIPAVLVEIPEKSYRDHLAFLNETEEGDL